MAEQTQITTGKSGVPSAKLAPGATFGHLLGGRWTSIPSHELLVLKLCQGLFDPVDEQSTAVADVEAARKKRFTKWLEDAVTQEMERDLEQHAADGNLAATVFTYLTGHRIKEACNAAIENRDHRLSTLLPQVIIGSETFRNYIKAQLRLWKDYQYEGMISKDYRKVYELMSGNVGLTHGMNGAVGDSDRVLVSEGLDWKRTLGLYIWYHSSPDSSLEEGLNKYLDAITHRELALRVAEPTPWYLGPHSVSPRRDMLFKIIKMYAQRSTDINIALDPLGITSDPLDYRMTWCLSVMLSKALNISTGFDNVTASFASQLEAMGLWEWAIYVQLHLDDNDR
jgi:nuclear pore complex protein Nup98-Nup96